MLGRVVKLRRVINCCHREANGRYQYGSISSSVAASARHLRPGLENPRTPLARRQGQSGPARTEPAPCRDTGITGAFSMRSSGFCALAPLGGTCPRTTATGRTPRIRYGAGSSSLLPLIVATPAGGQRRLGLLLEAVIDDPDFAWLMIDASHIKAHPHAAGRSGWQPGPGPHQRGLNSPPQADIWRWTLIRRRRTGTDAADRGNGGGWHASIGVD